MKRILSVLLALVMIVGMIPMSILSASAAENTVTIALAGSTGALSSDSSSISWQSGSINVTVFKNKGNAIRTTDTAHFRMYQSHTMSISCSAGNITKIEFACESGYVDSLATASGVTASGTTITVDLSSSSVASWTSEALSGSQSRIKSVVVTYSDVSSAECTHANTEAIAAVAATCTTAGNTAGVKCTDCGATLEGNETIAATGHTEDAVVTAATCTAQGYTTYTCSVCGNVRTADYVNATGHTLVDGVCSTCNAEQLDLSKASAIAVGDEVIFVCETALVEMNNFYGTSYAYGTAFTDDAPMGEYLWTVASGASEGTYAFVNSDSKYLAWASGNSAKTSDTLDANSSWTVSFEDGNAVVKNAADATRQLQWNASNPRFACYTSAQTAIQIYVKACEHTNTTTTTVDATCTVAGSTTVTCDDCGETISTTVIEALGHNYGDDGVCSVCGAEYNCEHATTTTTTVDATCTVAGSVTVTCDACGEVISTEEIAALGHTEVVDEAVAATCTETGLTAGSHCSVCNEVIVAQTETEALGHSYAEGVCSVCGEAEPNEATYVFADYAQSASVSTATTYALDDKVSITLSSGYLTSQLRVYKGANVIFTSTRPIDAITFNGGYKEGNADIYVTTDGSTWKLLTEVAYVTTYTDYTVDLPINVIGVKIEVLDNQIRIMNATLKFGEFVECNHANATEVAAQAPTCTEIGYTAGMYCADCDTYTSGHEVVSATGHTYVYGESAITCSACDYNAAYTLSTIAEAKAYTDTTAVYYVKGIVTYVSGKNVYIEDATGAVCVYFAAAPSDIVLGDEILVWDTMTTYKGLIETTNTTSQEYVKVSSGNTLPSQTVSIADLLADTTNEYLAERVVIENVTMGVINTSGNTPLTDGDGNSISLYKVSGLNEAINVNDVVTATVIVSTYDAYQLLVNPGTAADDVVEVEHHDEVVIETITIAEAKAGTAGEYYQVEGVVTFIDGRNVYIQDATGGIVVYLTTNNTTAAIGDNIKAYGQLKLYNGLIELDGIDQTNTDQFEVLSNGNTVDAQTVTVADVANDTTNEYLAEKIVLNNVYVSYSYGYSSSYANVNYVLKDGDATVVLYRVPAATEADVMAGGTIINVEAIVSSYNGYQLRVVGVESVTVVGTCAHETTNLVNVAAATCTEAGYTGDTMCTVCQNYTVRGEATEALGHNFNANGVCDNNCGIVNVAAIDGTFYTTFADAYTAATEGQIIKLLAEVTVDAGFALDKNVIIDLNGNALNAIETDITGAIVVKDSASDTYAENVCGTLSDNGVIKVAAAEGYLAHYDEGEEEYSFHAYAVKLTYVTLKADADALGYKAQFFGDTVVQSYVTGFGFNLWVTESNVITKSQATAANEEIITLRLQGIMAANGGEMEIHAEAFVTFSNAGTVKSNSHSTTMKDTVETIETNLEDENSTVTYSAAQIKSIQALIAKYESKMEGWNIDTIKAWTAPTTEA